MPNATSGADEFFAQTVTEVSTFIPGFLAFVFFVVFLGGILRQKLRTGWADYSMWSVIASLSMFMIALIASTATGIIRLDLLIIVLVITIFSGVWFFMDRKASEV